MESTCKFYTVPGYVVRESFIQVDTQNKHHDRVWITDISGLILKTKTKTNIRNKKADVQLKFCLYSLKTGRRKNFKLILIIQIFLF